jgi:hypothetical protein
MKQLFLFALPLALFSCDPAPPSEASTDEVDTNAVASEMGDTMVDLSSHDLPLRLSAPDAQATMGAALAIRQNEERGWLEIDRGEHFMLRISETEGNDLARLKEDLQRDQLRKATVIDERPGLLLYKLEFPADPSLVFVHFLREIAVGDRHFVVESAPDKTFNESDAWRMIAAISPVDPS